MGRHDYGCTGRDLCIREEHRDVQTYTKLKDLLLEEILCCITYNIGKLRKLKEYMKVKLRKFCEVMKILRERSYENFYNPPSSDGGA